MCPPLGTKYLNSLPEFQNNTNLLFCFCSIKNHNHLNSKGLDFLSLTTTITVKLHCLKTTTKHLHHTETWKPKCLHRTFMNATMQLGLQMAMSSRSSATEITWYTTTVWLWKSLYMLLRVFLFHWFGESAIFHSLFLQNISKELTW